VVDGKSQAHFSPRKSYWQSLRRLYIIGPEERLMNRGAADTTPVSELHMSGDTLVNITAYILQSNGAKPGNQPLTAKASALFHSVVE
jgi:hypothetical protein